VGSSAPAIKVARWIKGDKINSFEKGKVYVVEFWATWCGPCKQSIPHLTELAKKYAGKVTFMGVSCYEKNAPKGDYENYGDKVAAFVKDFGDKMDYNVAWDGDDAVMSKTWMEAADQNGIPTAFVVDGTSHIVWIGHPMMGLDETLGKVLDGTFDSKAEAARIAKAKEAEAKANEVTNSFMTPYRHKDYKAAVEAMDKAFANDSQLEMQYGLLKFMALGQYDVKQANAYADKLGDGIFKDQPMMLNSVAWTMVDDQHPMKGADIKVAIKLAEKAVAGGKDDDPSTAYSLDTLALAYFDDGQVEKAIATEEKALKIADSVKGFEADTRKEMAGRLATFKAKQAGK